MTTTVDRNLSLITFLVILINAVAQDLPEARTTVKFMLCFMKLKN